METTFMEDEEETPAETPAEETPAPEGRLDDEGEEGEKSEE